ncbi:phage regulatory CII family protein [Nostoc sp. NIES-2111]
MSVLDAAYWTGRDYPGGIKALADRIGHPNLSDELNPNRAFAKLGLQTAVDMQLMSGDFRILYEMAAETGHFPPLPMPELSVGQAPCLMTLSRLAQEFALLVSQVSTDLGDDEVTDRELDGLKRHWSDLQRVGQTLMQQLAAKNAELRARSPGGAL